MVIITIIKATNINRLFNFVKRLLLIRKKVTSFRKKVAFKPANSCGTGFRRGYKGLQRYEVPITKATTRICPVENSIFKPAVLSLFPLEPWDGLPSLRFARRSPLNPPVRRHVARGCRNFWIPAPPSLRLLVLVVCVKGVHKSPLDTFQGFHLIQPPQTRLKHAESVLRAFTKLSLDSPTKNVQKRQRRAFRGIQAVQ